MQPSDRTKIQVPDDFVRAWLHLLMGLIYSTQEELLWREHIHNVDSLLLKSMKQMTEAISRDASQGLLNRAVVLPLEIVSMICLNLFKDATNNHHDISETYSQYLKALVSPMLYPFSSPPQNRSSKSQ